MKCDLNSVVACGCFRSCSILWAVRCKSTDRMSDASQVLTGSIDNILRQLNRSTNCAALILQAKGIAEFVCKSVEQSKATSDLLELESVFQANKDLIPQFVRKPDRFQPL